MTFVVVGNLLLCVGLPIIICICIGCAIKYQKTRARRTVVTRVVSRDSRSRGMTLVPTIASSNPTATSFTSTLPYAQEPVYKDAQFTNPDAPPSYFEATAYPSHDVPQVAEVFCTHQCMN